MSESPSLCSKFRPQGVLVATPKTWSATPPSWSRGRSTWPRRPAGQEVPVPDQGVGMEVDDDEARVDAAGLLRDGPGRAGHPVQDAVHRAGPEEGEGGEPERSSDPQAPYDASPLPFPAGARGL